MFELGMIMMIISSLSLYGLAITSIFSSRPNSKLIRYCMVSGTVMSVLAFSIFAIRQMIR